MNILRLTDYGVVQTRRQVLELGNKRTLARGCFSAVFDGTRPETVLKLTLDNSQYCYMTDYTAPQGRYKPELVQDFGVVGETSRGESLYLLEIERLEPLPVGSPHKRLMRQILDWYVRHKRFPEELQEFETVLPQELLEFYRQLNWFLDNYECELDKKVGGNFMQRPADCSLVVSDPVFDSKLYRRYMRFH